jgi:predicted RNA-binding protein YlxR (DUF448 family)
MSEFLICYHHS